LARLFGVEARRGCQFAGGPDSPDIRTSIQGIHWEVKRTERLSVFAAVSQAAADAGEDEVPVVLHRANGKEWIAVCRLEDLPKLARMLAAYPLPTGGMLCNRTGWP